LTLWCYHVIINNNNNSFIAYCRDVTVDRSTAFLTAPWVALHPTPTTRSLKMMYISAIEVSTSALYLGAADVTVVE